MEVRSRCESTTLDESRCSVYRIVARQADLFSSPVSHTLHITLMSVYLPVCPTVAVLGKKYLGGLAPHHLGGNHG